MPAFEWNHELPRLSGKQLHLRWLTQQDSTAILNIFGDLEVMKFWSSPPFPDLATASKHIEEIHQLFLARRAFQWGICHHETNEVFGTCTLFDLNVPHRRAEVGIALAQNTWGKGLASEALSILFGFAFDVLNLHRLEADIDPKNERSLRAFKRQGFRTEGYLRERWHHLGKLHDTVFLGLLQREWLKP